MRVEAQNGIADIVVVRHLALIEQNDILKLTGISDNAALADQCLAANEGALTNFGVFIDDAGTGNVGRVKYPGAFGNPYILAALFKAILRERFSQRQDDLLYVRKDLPGIGICL